MSTSHPTSAHAVTAVDFVSAFVAPIAKLAQFFRREAEIAHAERHMEKLNDDLLNDIGVHRSQIHFATRIGRSEFGRRYL